MIGRPLRLCAVLALAAGSVVCAGKAAPTAVPTSPHDLVVLLSDPDSGQVGRAIVSSGGASVELQAARQATRVSVGQPPSAPALIDEAEVQRLFGDALAARPPAPRQFLLYFVTGSETLTAESQKLLPEILAFVKTRPAPDITVIGHTDTTDSAQNNVALGGRRATLIRDRLVDEGLPASQVEVVSHGEADLLVRTPDNMAEARNRRVEVTVR